MTETLLMLLLEPSEHSMFTERLAHMPMMCSGPTTAPSCMSMCGPKLGTNGRMLLRQSRSGMLRSLSAVKRSLRLDGSMHQQYGEGEPPDPRITEPAGILRSLKRIYIAASSSPVGYQRGIYHGDVSCALGGCAAVRADSSGRPREER